MCWKAHFHPKGPLAGAWTPSRTQARVCSLAHDREVLRLCCSSASSLSTLPCANAAAVASFPSLVSFCKLCSQSPYMQHSVGIALNLSHVRFRSRLSCRHTKTSQPEAELSSNFVHVDLAKCHRYAHQLASRDCVVVGRADRVLIGRHECDIGGFAIILLLVEIELVCVSCRNAQDWNTTIFDNLADRMLRWLDGATVAALSRVRSGRVGASFGRCSVTHRSPESARRTLSSRDGRRSIPAIAIGVHRLSLLIRKGDCRLSTGTLTK